MELSYYKELVREWHKKFKIEPIKKMSEIDDFLNLRKKLFIEEFDEYYDAGEDIVERGDAIVDMAYIHCGTLEILERTQVTLRDVIKERSAFRVIKGSEMVIEQLLNLPENKLIKEKFKELFEEVNRSNHSKADENGNPIFREDGKLLKGSNYFKPQIKKILFYDDE